MNTLAGMIAVVFWSLSIPLSRSLTEKVGMFHTAGLACIIGGSLPVMYFLLVYRSRFGDLLHFSRRHLLCCGTTFILNHDSRD